MEPKRDVMAKEVYSFGHQAMAAVPKTTVIAMGIRIQSIQSPSRQRLSWKTFRGTQNIVSRPWRQHTLLAPIQKRKH